MSKKEIIVPCPTCKIPVPRSEENFPFCSERCKTIDLGNWASDAYAIPDSSAPDQSMPDYEDDEHKVIH
jgi:endogenous inhibitor of DNA gyrase (YacG/DUF329 family)